MAKEIKIKSLVLESGQVTDVIVLDWRSPTGAWYGETTENGTVLLCDVDGDYIPAPKQ